MNKRSANITTTSSRKDYLRERSRLEQSGYTAMPHSLIDGNGYQPTFGDYIHSQLSGGEKMDGRKHRRDIPMLYASSGNEQMQGSENLGTPGLGWMEWGNGNNLPNVVALLTNMLPYTAAGWDFNAKLIASLGPEPVYRYSRYSGGAVTPHAIPFSEAGIYIKGRIRDLRQQILTMSGDTTFQSKDANAMRKDIEDEIKTLNSDYDKWKNTNTALQDFLKRNNLAHTFLTLACDFAMFDLAYPEIQLNQQDLDTNGKPVQTANWTPRITGITARPAMTCRMERMDKENRINYIYISNRWLDKPYVETGQAAPEIACLPALSVIAPYVDLEDKVREARQKNVSVKNRPTRFILPCYSPTVGRPYYPHPAWHSIFGGDIYEYAATIISDRVTRKKNANVIGRIIYINNEYIQNIYRQRGCQTNDEKDAVLKEVYTEINEWLSNRDNSGQSLIAFNFTSADGKEHKSFEVVELESNNKDSADANQKELAEVNSIITMAMGQDMKLLGSSPLDVAGSSSGGTDLRERYLLRQIMKAPVQRILLEPLKVIRDFNGWDEHLDWQFKREVLTTLDNSKTGVTEQEQ